MPCRRIRSRFFPVGSAVLLALALSLSAAQPAGAGTGLSADRWRVVTTVGPSDGVTGPRYFAVTGRDDAWSWWTGCAPCANTHSYDLLRRWNGARWIAMKIPAAAQGGIVGLAASSAHNAWLFTVRAATPGNTLAEHVVIWNGRTWRSVAIPDWVIQFSRAGFYWVDPVVFSPENVWAFGVGAYASHYNGRTWVRKKMPGIAVGVSSISATDIWAMGYQLPAYRQILMHWDGTSWHVLPIPKPARVPTGSTESVGGLTATGPDSAWLVRDIQTGSQGTRPLYLMHWGGRAWSRIQFGLLTSSVDQMAQDGHGGLWLATNGPAPGYQWYFDHLRAPGSWTRQAFPARSELGFLQAGSPMTWIPGTRSLWAVGTLRPPRNASDVLGAIFKYGP